MKPQLLALLTAMALVILGAVSFLQWKTIPQAGSKALLYKEITFLVA